jgi:dTDP-4-amino-4,6-dideoxygalactose transaminase
MTGRLLMPLAPLDPAVWTRRRLRRLPFPLGDADCRLFARARHALWYGLRALGIGDGDEVLAPAYHHGSEIEALVRVGARPVFYEPGERLEPDEEELERLVGERTRALHLTHHLGFPQDARRWRRWCDRRGLALIEDVAQAWMAQVDERPAGAFGDLAIFCLYKSFGLPDGAALICRTALPEANGAGKAGVAGLRLGLEHAAWLAGRSAPLGSFVTRVRPPRHYDPARDFALGTPAPPARASVLALGRVAEPEAAERRRANYQLLLDRLGDRVHPAFAAMPDGACPFVFPAATDRKAAVLRTLRAAGIRPLDVWSVPHPAHSGAGGSRAAALRRSLVGLPVHQELQRRDLERIAKEVRAAR